VRWESSGGGSFTVEAAERDRPGTTITLHLKPVDTENGIEDYTDRWVLSRIVRQHADFIPYPVLLPAEKPEEVPEGETPEPEKPLNSMKPIWTRPPAEVTKEEYADFVARLEFKVPPGGNNGLAIRYPGKGDTAYEGMTEIQVLDDNYEKVRGPIDPRQAHGSVYGMIAAARGYQYPVGEWNYEEVTVKGPKIRVELNGTVILDGDVSKVTDFMGGKPHPGMARASGYFGFAGHSDPVMFRNVAIKKLN